MTIKPSYIIIVFLFLVLFLTNIGERKTEIRTEYKTDTVFTYRVDTFTHFIVKADKVIHLDTIWLKTPSKEDSVAIEMEQKYYNSKGIYEAWISGYKTNLDSLKVYQKTEYRTITNLVKEQIYKNGYNLYIEADIFALNKEVIPSIGLRLNMPNNVSIGGRIGVYENKANYGISLGYKLK